MGWRAGWLGPVALSLGLSMGAPASGQAQTTFEVPPPVVVIDRERLFEETVFGQNITADIESRANALARENRLIEQDLTVEEQDLTERRPSLTVEEFRELADAFDAKVQSIREAQDAKARAVAQLTETGRQRFLEAIIPVLTAVLRERGALVVLDRRDVFLSADSIDITDTVIERINVSIGDGSETADPVAGD